MTVRAAGSRSGDCGWARTAGLARDQLAVGYAVHRPVADGEPLDRNAEALGREPGEHGACLRRGAGSRCRFPASSWLPAVYCFVGRARGVGGDELDARGLDHQLFGRHLDERGLDALYELGLAGENGDAAIGADADPGIEHRLVVQAARELAGLRARQTRQERKADDECAAARDEAAPVHGCGHRAPTHGCGHSAPTHGSRAARSTARRIRMWVPQRQRFPLICLRISALVGGGVRSSSACAWRIIPGMQ
jgi:hypothetical protein